MSHYDYPPYEQKVIRELKLWHVAGSESTLLDVLHRIGTPVRAALRHVSPATRAIGEQLGGAILHGFQEWSHQPFAFDTLQPPLQTLGLAAGSIQDIASTLTLEQCDQLAVEGTHEHLGYATLSGSAGGMMGLPGILADAVAFLAINYRMLRLMAASYGFDPQDERVATLLLGIMALGGKSDPSDTESTFPAFDAMASKVGCYFLVKQLALGLNRGGGVLSAQLLSRFAGRFAGVISSKVADGALGKALPLVSIAIGGAVGYSFTEQNFVHGTNLLREQYLERKYGFDMLWQSAQ